MFFLFFFNYIYLIFILMVTFFYFSTVSSPTNYLYSGYSSDEMSEYEYADPFEGEGPHSETPPPVCDNPDHEVCIPPAWGERIPGPVVTCRCVLCHKDSCHHAIRCVQCHNAPGCCQIHAQPVQFRLPPLPGREPLWGEPPRGESAKTGASEEGGGHLSQQNGQKRC